MVRPLRRLRHRPLDRASRSHRDRTRPTPVRDEVVGVLIEYGEVRLRELRQVAVQLARLEAKPVTPGKPLLATSTCRRFTGRDPVELSCAVPLAGDADLFRRSVAAWPSPQRLRGRVQGSGLILTAEGWTGDGP